jgi:hypothetical protein
VANPTEGPFKNPQRPVFTISPFFSIWRDTKLQVSSSLPSMTALQYNLIRVDLTAMAQKKERVEIPFDGDINQIPITPAPAFSSDPVYTALLHRIIELERQINARSVQEFGSQALTLFQDPFTIGLVLGFLAGYIIARASRQ